MEAAAEFEPWPDSPLSGYGSSSAASSPTGRSRWRAPPKLRAAGHETPEDAALSAARAMLDVEKLRSVAAHPFVGCRMKFEANCAVLQITNDGRFSYSTFEPGPTREEVASGAKKTFPRVVVTWEGVFSANPASFVAEASSDDAAAAGAPPEAAASAVGAGGGAGGGEAASDPHCLAASSSSSQVALMMADSAARAVEGRGLVQHEAEEYQGQSRVLRVARGEQRFSISVSPFYDPCIAIVQPWGAEKAQVLEIAPHAEDRRHADLRPQRAVPPKLQPLPPHRQRMARQPGRPRAPRLRFSPSATDLQGLSCGPRSNGRGNGGGAARKIMFYSSSMPQLKEKQADANGWTKDHWKLHFQGSGTALLQELRSNQGSRPTTPAEAAACRPSTAP